MESELNVKNTTAYLYSLGYFLAVIFSLTLLFPWAFMKYHGWLVSNTKLNGKKLVFDGRTKHLYLIYITGIIFGAIAFSAFTFITALISVLLEKNGYETNLFESLVFKTFGPIFTLFFSIFVTSRFYKYRSIHTHYESYKDTKSGIRLELYKVILSSIIFKIIILSTSFIGYPFALNIRERFLQSRRYVDGDNLKFKGSIARICLIWYLGLLLSGITLLLYVPFLFFKLNKYIITNTVLKNNRENIEVMDLKMS